MAARNTKDLIGGILYTAFGLAFLIGAFDYRMGTARAMGPGYFPMLIGSVATIVGLLIAVPAALSRDGGQAPLVRPVWRPVVMILLGILMFGLAMEWFGLLAAVFVSVLVSAFADRSARPLGAVLLAAATAAWIWVVFAVGLGLPIPLIKGL